MVFYIGVGRVSSDTLSIAQVVIEDLGQLVPWKELKELVTCDPYNVVLFILFIFSFTLSRKCSVVQQDGIVLGSMTYHCYLEVDQAVRKHEGTGQIKMKNVKFILPQKVFNQYVWLLWCSLLRLLCGCVFTDYSSPL